MFIPGNLSAKSKIRTSFTQSIQRHRRTAETFSKIQILGLDSPDKKQHNTQRERQPTRKTVTDPLGAPLSSFIERGQEAKVYLMNESED